MNIVISKHDFYQATIDMIHMRMDEIDERQTNIISTLKTGGLSIDRIALGTEFSELTKEFQELTKEHSNICDKRMLEREDYMNYYIN